MKPFPYLVETGKFVVAMSGFDHSYDEFQHTLMITDNSDTKVFKYLEDAKKAADEWSKDHWGKPVCILQVVCEKVTVS